jgi:hypothetical protein
MRYLGEARCASAEITGVPALTSACRGLKLDNEDIGTGMVREAAGIE